MLSNNHICKVQSQYFKQLEQAYFQRSFSEVPCSLLMSLRDMFNKNKEMCYAFAVEAYRYMITANKCNGDDFENSYELMATYGVSMSSVLWGYSLKNGSMSLYTTSIGILNGLASRGILKGKKEPIAIELQNIEKTLYQSDRIKKSLRECKNKLVCVRLDTELQGNNLVMKCTVPRSAPTLDDTIFIPFDAVKCATDMLHNILQSRILRVRMGDKVRDVTLNHEVLASIYGERANMLSSFIPDVYTQRFYVASVGASKYTLGVTNIKLAEIDEIKPVSLADIDLSEINLDYSMVYDHFKERVDKIPENKLGIIAEDFGLDCLNAPSDDIRLRLKDVCLELYPKDIWDIMKKYPRVFATSSYMKKKSKYGDNYTRVEKPKSVSELVDLLKSGVYKIVITKRNGTFSTIIGTNNEKCLQRILGADYIAKYESLGVRLRYAKHLFDSGKSLGEVRKLSGLQELGTSGIDLATELNERLGEIEMKKTVVKQNHLVGVRNLQVTSEKDFYKNIDINSIVEVISLS